MNKAEEELVIELIRYVSGAFNAQFTLRYGVFAIAQPRVDAMLNRLSIFGQSLAFDVMNSKIGLYLDICKPQFEVYECIACYTLLELEKSIASRFWHTVNAMQSLDPQLMQSIFMKQLVSELHKDTMLLLLKSAKERSKLNDYQKLAIHTLQSELAQQRYMQYSYRENFA